MPTPIPPFFNPQTAGQIWRVPYQTRATEAQAYAHTHSIPPAHTDRTRVCLLAIDVQNTFCLPDFELFVGGRSGVGAVEDTWRLCEFIYRHLDVITEIAPTMDTHAATQIFHAVFWVNAAGEHPAPMTSISFEDVEQGKWQVNPLVAKSLASRQSASPNSHNSDPSEIEDFARHYTRQLSDRGKYPLTIWPYHSMLGGIGHALVPAFEEACFFHNSVRTSQTRFEIKGDNPLTENYSVLSPEILNDATDQPIAKKNSAFIQHLLGFDAVIIAGQAKSHCVAWTVSDLLSEIQQVDPALAQKVYLLDDCTSPVVVPDVVDFTDAAEEAYQRFAKAGMNIVCSTDSLEAWPSFPLS
ncbi:isochorismatase [Leptolyngbya sp. BC1307]|uniref:isochorismatase n=1 Tax=Leptolyngbya sp. BC1307 TaxID=2029589 RepID=UPI000EFBB10F|nr:isochorismatase [Leptolyngbya sp. BC1307]